ncbi:MAG TPA: pilus assembly protein TadG-related protein [Gemmataceae bacterium]|nr:pilus assembly protein TadG-related protein [Gemmataceae bacterium]
MKRFDKQSAQRKGAIVPLAALLMGLMVGMLAFSIDIGYMCAVKAELQNAADAAALAGANQLETLYVQYYSPGATNQSSVYNLATSDTTNASSPIPTAQRFAAYNQAGGVHINVPASDITFSYNDGTNAPVPASTILFPNTITVTTRRDSTANSPLGLFFAKIFGMSTADLTATASATIYAGDISSLQVISGVNAHILPVALDINVWTNYSQNNFASPWLAGKTSAGPNGNPQLQIYPDNTNTPGSFGLLDVGTPSNSAPAFRSWIDDGATPNDISYLLTNNLLPVSPSSPEPWKCGPGLKSTLLSNFQGQIGEPNLIPLFAPVSSLPNYTAATGNGQNATYAIIGFVGVTITQATGNGSNMNISIQPMAINDPTSIILNPSPARATKTTIYGTSQTTFVSPKLTQ